VVVASKGRFDRARRPGRREEEGLPHENTVTTDEFMEATLDLWRIDAEQATRVGHPAPFPVELPRRLIDLYTFRDDVVLAPFLGSGSTLVAALRAGRRGVGYDVDADYVALAARRLENERQRLAEGVAAWRRRDLAGTTTSQEGLFARLDGSDQAQDWAVGTGKKAGDIAKEALVSAGFEIVKAPAICRDLGIQFPFTVTDRAAGRLWYVEVAGAFTTARPGMRRADVLWRTLGRAHVLVSGHTGLDPLERPRLLILTPRLPRPSSEGDRALRAVGGTGFFDAVELFEPTDVDRLVHYANQPGDRPLPGFWTEDEIAFRFQ